MTDKCKIFKDCRTAILLPYLKISTLCTIPCGFYASPNAQNRMCELCTFSQIQSQILCEELLVLHTNLVIVCTNNVHWFLE